MDSHNNKTAVKLFAAAFAGAVSDAIGQAIGSAWPLEAMDAQEPSTRKGQPVQVRLKAEGGLRGECFIEFYEPQISELIAKLSNGDPAAGAAEPGKALSAVIASAATALSASLAAQFGEASFKVEPVSGLAFGGMYVVPLAVRADRSGDTVLLYCDGELLEALGSAPAGETHGDAGERGVHPSNLKLVMDVELNVSLRFGQRQLPLREVLELGSGSVVELDRMVDEPVELLLDGKLVARGEAVIVDGNYGLRITEIPQAVETHFLR